MFSPWKYINKKNFTPPYLIVQEIFRDQAAKQGFYANKDFINILQAAELGLVLFEIELLTTSDEGKGFFNFCFVPFFGSSKPQKSRNVKLGLLENSGFP